MKTTLTIRDRVYFPAILPSEGAMIEMITVRGIIKKVEITPEEIQELNIEDTPRGVEWKKDKDIEVDFTEAEIEIIRKGIKQLDEAGKIAFSMLPTVEKLYITT